MVLFGFWGTGGGELVCTKVEAIEERERIGFKICYNGLSLGRIKWHT